jgi:hypothetical protein
MKDSHNRLWVLAASTKQEKENWKKFVQAIA